MMTTGVTSSASHLMAVSSTHRFSKRCWDTTANQSFEIESDEKLKRLTGATVGTLGSIIVGGEGGIKATQETLKNTQIRSLFRR